MCIFIGFFSFVLVSMVLQSSIGGLFGVGGAMGLGRRRSVELEFGSSLRFVANLGAGREAQRTKPRVGVRSPSLAIGT